MALEIIYEIVHAFLKSMCSIKMIHRKIRPKHILFNKLKNGKWEFKFCDLGTPEIFEAILSTKRYPKADIFAIGMIAFELFTGSKTVTHANPSYKENEFQSEIEKKL